MTEPTVEMIPPAPAFPAYAVRVWAPADAWRQESGKPGLADFAVFEVAATETDGTALYDLPESMSSGGPHTADIERAARCAGGTVKWDGCVNYEVGLIDAGTACMLHACSGEDLGFFLQAIRRGYDLALEIVGGGL